MSSSLFALPEMPEVPNQGLLGAHYERCELTQGLAYRQDTFANSRLEFRWNAGAANYWYVPARSYLRMRFKLLYNTHGSNQMYPAHMLNQLWLGINDYQNHDSFVQRFMSNHFCAVYLARAFLIETAFYEGKTVLAVCRDKFGGSVVSDDGSTTEPTYERMLNHYKFYVAVSGPTIVNGATFQHGFTTTVGGLAQVDINKSMVDAAINHLLRMVEFFIAGLVPDGLAVAIIRPAEGDADNKNSGVARVEINEPMRGACLQPTSMSGETTVGASMTDQTLPFLLNNSVFNVKLAASGGKATWTTGVTVTKPNRSLIDDAQSVSSYLKQKTLSAIAPAHACASHMFSAASITYGGQVVSAINQHMPLIDAYDKRINQTNPYFERYGPGNLSNFYSPYFEDRAALVAEDGYVEICWQPPLSFFRFPHAIPSGDFRLNLAVSSKWRENAFQVVGYQAYRQELLNNGDHRSTYQVDDMSITMFNYFVQGPSTDTARFVLDLENIAVQSQQMTSQNQTTQFDVSDQSTTVAIAHVDLTDGPWTQGRSLFRCPIRAPGNLCMFPWTDAVPSYWSTFQLLFDGRQWPQQLADPIGSDINQSEYPLDRKEFPFLQLYLDHTAHTGLLYSPAGPEDYKLWKDQGLLLHTAWPRSNSNATRIQLQERFKNLSWASNTPIDVLVFTKFRKGYIINIANQRVMRVDTPQNSTDGAVTG